jgi:tRNA (guanine37-N1)-methyltransferase
MVMKPEPLAAAISEAKHEYPDAPVVLLSPQGRVFSQKVARELACRPALILVCGRYEGIDERIVESLIDEEISTGDYILSGGEPAAMVVMDAVARLVPGVLGNDESARDESFESVLLEHAHYTRPRVFEEEAVPVVLVSGDHQSVKTWRDETALLRTVVRRPDLLSGATLSERQVEMLKDWGERIGEMLRGLK